MLLGFKTKITIAIVVVLYFLLGGPITILIHQNNPERNFVDERLRSIKPRFGDKK